MIGTIPAHEVADTYNRLTEDELANLGIVLGAYRSFRGNRRAHIAYVSMPISSGKRLYDVFYEERVRTVRELTQKCGEDALWERVIRPNITDGITLADSLGKRENLLFIAPSVFEARKWRWTQDAYMSLWYRVIGEMACKLVVMDGWEYSNGGVDEVLFALYLHWRLFRMSTLREGAAHFNLKNFCSDMPTEELWRELEAMWAMRIFDARGKELRLDVLLKMCVDAVLDLRERELPYNDILWRANKMKAIWAFAPNFYEPDDGNGSIVDSLVYQRARSQIQELLQ